MNQHGMGPPWRGMPYSENQQFDAAYNSNRSDAYKNFSQRRGHYPRKSRWGSPNKNDKKEGGFVPQRGSNCSSTLQFPGRGRSPYQSGRGLLGRPPRGSLLGRSPRGSILGRPPQSGLPGRSPINCSTSRPFHSECDEEEDANEISNWLKSNKPAKIDQEDRSLLKDPLPGSEEEREHALKKATEQLKESLKNKISVNLNKLITEEEAKKQSHALPHKISQPKNLAELELDALDMRSIGRANVEKGSVIDNNNSDDDEILVLSRPPSPVRDLINIEDNDSSLEISPKKKKTARKNFADLPNENKKSEDANRQNKIISDLQKITKNKLRDIINNPRSGKFDHAMTQLMRAQRNQISQKSRENAEKNLTNLNLKPTDDIVDERTVLADLSIDWANLPPELINTLGDLFNIEEVTSPSPEPARCQEIDIHDDFVKLETISVKCHPMIRVKGFAREFTSECESDEAKNHVTTKEEKCTDESSNKLLELPEQNIVVTSTKEKESIDLGNDTCPEQNIVATSTKEKQCIDLGNDTCPEQNIVATSTKEKQCIDLSVKECIDLGNDTCPEQNIVATSTKEKQCIDLGNDTCPEQNIVATSTKEKQCIDLGVKSLGDGKLKENNQENSNCEELTLSRENINIQTPIIMPIFCTPILARSNKKSTSNMTTSQIQKRINEIDEKLKDLVQERYFMSETLAVRMAEESVCSVQEEMDVGTEELPLSKRKLSTVPNNQNRKKRRIEVELVNLDSNKTKSNQIIKGSSQEEKSKKRKKGDISLKNKSSSSTPKSNGKIVEEPKSKSKEKPAFPKDNKSSSSTPKSNRKIVEEPKSKSKEKPAFPKDNKSSSSTPKSNGKIVEEPKSKSKEKPASPKDNQSVSKTMKNGLQNETIPSGNNRIVIKELPRMDGYILDVKVYKESYFACSQNGITYQNKIEKNQLFATYGDKSVPGLNCIDVMEDTLFTGGEDGFLRVYSIPQLGAHEVKFDIKSQKSLNLSNSISFISCNWGTAYVGTKSGSICPYILKTEKLAATLSVEGNAVLAIKGHKEGPRKILIISCRHQPISIRDAESGLLLRQFGSATQTVYCLNLYDNLLFCGTDGSHILVYDFQGGILKYKLSVGKGIVNIVQVDEVLFAGSYDGNIYVFDVQEQKGVITLRGPGKMILCISVINRKLYCSSKNSTTLMVTELTNKIKSVMDKNRQLKGIK